MVVVREGDKPRKGAGYIVALCHPTQHGHSSWNVANNVKLETKR